MILDEIVENKKAELEQRKDYYPLEVIMEKIDREFRNPRSLAPALTKREGASAVRIIAEVKRASPSKGIIRQNFMAGEIARLYELNGAAAISVLTEEKYFKGNIEYLSAIRRNSKIPVLRKDFIFDEYQVYESRAAGADAILLIVAILDKEKLKKLMDLSASLGMSTLVEVHNESELETALEAGANIIGVNNRDLKTFKTDINVTVRLIPYVPKDVILVSESGINTVDDIVELMKEGVDAFLIGEALMREEDIAKKLKQLRGII